MILTAICIVGYLVCYPTLVEGHVLLVPFPLLRLPQLIWLTDLKLEQLGSFNCKTTIAPTQR